MVNKKKFTLIELLVVITIIAILAGMLFPVFGDMQRKANHTLSKNICKSHNDLIIAYFSDPRKKQLPHLNKVYPDLRYNNTSVVIAKTADPAGAEYFGYFRGVFIDPQREYPHNSNYFHLADTELLKYNNTLSISSDNSGKSPKAVDWHHVNNDLSVISTAKKKWLKSRYMKPVAFGDGHVNASGVD